MTENRLFAGWLRSITALAAVAGTLGLSACGGGSGAPNNPFLGPLAVLPATIVVYSGVPATLTISGGTGPYSAFSSNPALLPVQQTVPAKTVVLLAGNVDVDTTATITVQETGTLQPVGAQVPVTVTVRPAALSNLLSIMPNLTECGTAICSGQTGTASATVLSPQGGPIAGRAVRFDVVGTAYAIAANTAQPYVSSLIVVSDANGVASVIIRANPGAATQFAQLTVTDLTSGQQRTLNFVIQQVINGSAILSVVPDTVTITGAFTDECSIGFATNYFIYGGTPPYRITSTFPNSITLVNSVVNVTGGFFQAITNGSCVKPLTFSIVDASGLQTTAELNNTPGTATRPAVIPPLSVTPTPIPPTAGNCSNLLANVAVSGGTAPYNIVQTSTSSPSVAPVNLSDAGIATLNFPATPDTATDYSFKVLDSSNPQKSSSFSYNCN